MKIIPIIMLALFLSTSAFSQTETYYSTNGTAIKGYDPVAYFTQNEAVKGSDQFTVEWSGIKWKFSSQENLDSFKLDPLKYVPQYGGYCAYGVSENHKSPTDPKAWTIVNDKLYLNYNLEVKALWTIDKDTRIKTADANWPTLNK